MEKDKIAQTEANEKKSKQINSLKAENQDIKLTSERQRLEIQNLHEKISLQQSTQKQLFKELECSFIANDNLARKSYPSTKGKVDPQSLASAMKRFSIDEGEAHLDRDKSMIVTDIEMQVKELEMDRD